MASVKENLIAAKALINTPEKWIKGSLGRNGCYCALGALNCIEPFEWDSAETVALKKSLPQPFGDTTGLNHPVVEFNDDPATTHDDIMALFDRAIAAQDGAK